MHHLRTGSGPPLILVHGLGNTPRAWDPIVPALAAQRDLIIVTLPGHDGEPMEHDSGTFAGLARSVADFVAEHRLENAAMTGSSLGARVVLELARRGHSGPVVALDPGGFWLGAERTMFRTTLRASLALLKVLDRSHILKPLARSAFGRTFLLAQLSAHPWQLDGTIVANELESLARTPTAGMLIDDLARGPAQKGPAAAGAGRVTIGWGRRDRLCLARQSRRALAAFPRAHMHWFDHSGHYPMWDEPAATARVILDATA
ncbi:alpha/beta fold hydrolase [Sphingomonas ginkgonis]|uniref:Alpha/beta fold hydrolase n=1 Tax=Sphingomonas ginkgonis TaxID=2315330 RepID=A0A429VBL0_9SPHN|nr:alpha/beta fold hydrolase [Sphingomonas ginkgonis]RST31344.1 alpha/beta fold hydrolase [Sphingomonas ginkgonis]